MWLPVMEIARAYQEEMIRQAQLAGALRRLRTPRPGLPDRLLLMSGNALITLGVWIKQRSGVPGEPHPRPYYEYT